MKEKMKMKAYSRKTKFNTFYRKYLNIDKTTINLSDTISAPSPFGDGLIEVQPDGTFNCQSTGQSGTPVDFIKHLEPFATDVGAQLIVNEDNRLEPDVLAKADDRINGFRNDPDLLEVASEKIGLTQKQMASLDVFMDQRGFRYHVISDRSPSGKALSVSTFRPGDYSRTTIGVLRPLKPEIQRVWITENPLIASMVKSQLDEDAFCWPTERELPLFDHKSMLKGKDIVVIHSELNCSYEDSFYPFFENIRRIAGSFSIVRYESLCKGELFLEWLQHKNHRDQLRDAANSSQGIQPITKSLYQKYIRLNDTLSVEYPQCSARGYFFYGTSENIVAQSYPLNLDNVAQTEKNFRLRFIMPERFGSHIKLTPERVLAISQSVGQLTPGNTFQQLRKLIREHIYLDNPEMETLITLWIMGSYVHVLFKAYPYVHLNADKGSGKTTLLELFKACSFNGTLASRITSANLMQTISDTACTLCLDEFEKGSGGQGDSHTHILNSGYKRGANYRRLRGHNTDSLNLYSPKVYASIDAIKAEALASRTLLVEMLRKPMHHKLRGWDPGDPRIIKQVNEIQNGGYALGLYNHETIEYLLARMKTQIQLPSGLTIDGRQRELVTPLVIIAQLIDLQGSVPSVEKELYIAIQRLLFPEHELDLQRMKILANQLKQWSEDTDAFHFTIVDEVCWIDNNSWEQTGLMSHFDNKRNDMLDWIKGLSDQVKRETKHIPAVGTQSCIGFPMHLKLNGKTFRDWFSPDDTSKAA